MMPDFVGSVVIPATLYVVGKPDGVDVSPTVFPYCDVAVIKYGEPVLLFILLPQLFVPSVKPSVIPLPTTRPVWLFLSGKLNVDLMRQFMLL